MAGPSLLDTNMILRHVLDDLPDQSPRAHAPFARIERGERRVRTTDTVLFEAVYTLESFYRVPRAEIAAQLLDILRLPGVILPGKRLYRRVFELYVAHRRLSFADCFHTVMVERYGLASILSFDRDFDRVPGLVREEPAADGVTTRRERGDRARPAR
jgi:predicted nucleic acid-binding protein